MLALGPMNWIRPTFAFYSHNLPFGYHHSNVLENFTKAKVNDANRKFEKFSASALFIFCEPNFLLGNPKGTDICSL